jgi:hypothetical protein
MNESLELTPDAALPTQNIHLLMQQTGIAARKQS